MNKRLTVLTYIDTEDTGLISRSVDSVYQAVSFPKEEIQLILLNSSSSLAVENILRQLSTQYGESIEIRNTSHLVQKGEEAVLPYSSEYAPAAYNEALPYIEGAQVAFMLASSWYDKNALQDLLTGEYKDEELISLRPHYYHDGPSVQEYYMIPDMEELKKEQLLFEGEKELTHSQPVLMAYIIRRDIMDGLFFLPDLKQEAFPRFVLELLVRTRGRVYYDHSRICYYTQELENNWEFYAPASQKWWYQDSVNKFILPTLSWLEGIYPDGIPKYLQRIVYYYLSVKFECNLSGRDKLVLAGEQIEEFYGLAEEVCTHLDNDVLLLLRMPRPLKILLLKGKAKRMGCEMKVQIDDNAAWCHFVNKEGFDLLKPALIADLKLERFFIQVINYHKGSLEFDGYFKGAAYLNEGEFEVFCQSGNKKCKWNAIPTEIYSNLKCFGQIYGRKYQIHFDIPLQDIMDNGGKLIFYASSMGTTFALDLEFRSMASRLMTYSQKAYWRFNKKQYMMYRTGKTLHFEKSNWLKTVKHELFVEALFAIQKDKKEAFNAMKTRAIYWLTKPFYKNKRIWITFDKLYKGGDNGQYFFEYCQTRKDGPECYYIINRDAPDAPALVKKYGKKVLFFGTRKVHLMTLRAEAIMATHAGTAAFLAIPGPIQKYYKDIYDADNICIQHGLSIQDIASFQHRLYANTKLYCCASPVEISNIGRPEYGYEPEMLKLTGLARYDGLKSKGKKQILITPTWRKNIIHVEGVGMTNRHNDTFKTTAYYRIYNSLINDPRLIECAKKLGYEIVFLLHPAMSAQIDDYDRNDYVKLLQATGGVSYEQLLTESSLMVTDYSGVQYDFAYQRKPLIYYHPSELPPHYVEGGLKYDTMGFGPICTEHEELIDLLCKYMENDCRTEEEYIDRANAFFTYDDFENCARIYQAVLDFENEGAYH